jgi:S1-C subfamily serine protease
MRRLLSILLVAFVAAGCDAPPSQLRQVTIESPPQLGLSLRELPASALRSMGLVYGLTVVKAGTLADPQARLLGEKAGLRVGDVVYGVNQQRLRTIEDFTRFAAERPDGRLGLLVRRGGVDFYVPMDLTGGSPDGLPRPSKDTLLRT